jgi:plasmid stabilization system protein ParE
VSRVVRFHPQAEAELEAALVWYGDLRPELAARLLATIEASIARLAQHPALGSQSAEGVIWKLIK